MLHRVNKPHCVTHFTGILAFQRKVLEFACSLTDPRQLTRGRVRREFDVAAGWLCERLWDGGNRTEFQHFLLNVIRHVKADSDLRRAILEAFDNDIEFHKHLDDADFRFRYRVSLDKATRDVIRPLMEAFYNKFFATNTGFSTEIHGQPGTFNRHSLVNAFFTSNQEMDVCPACDDRRTDLHLADTDHVFPKKEYPFLSVHWANLLPVCTDCNRLFKLAKDPLEEADHNAEPMLKTFHAYDVPAIDHIRVLVSRPMAGERQINLIDSVTMPSRRVENFNRLLTIEARWRDRVNEFVNSIVESIRGQSRSIHRLGQHLRAEELLQHLREELDDMLRERRKSIGKTRGYVLHCGYLQLAIDDDDELQELLAQFSEALDILQGRYAGSSRTAA